MAVIITTEYIKKYNIENQIAKTSKVYNHDNSLTINKQLIFNKPNCIDDRTKIISLPSGGWKENSQSWSELWTEAEDLHKKIKKYTKVKREGKKINIIHMPPEAQDFFDLMRIDITRLIMTMPDLTGFFARVRQDDNFTDPLKLQELYEYGAPFLPFSGRGDKVKLIYVQEGALDQVEFSFWGIGWEQDLYNQLFNKIFDAQKVNRAIVRGYVARKNDRVIKPIIDFNYSTPKIVTAVTGGSVEENYYNTYNKAINQLGLLYDPQTKKEIDILNGLTLVCHSTKTRTTNRIINGRLLNGSDVKNLDALTEIKRIVPYNGDRIPYGENYEEYDGIPKDKAYLFVNNAPLWYLLKRDLTSQSWEGTDYSFSSRKSASYFCDTRYHEEFLGGADGSGGSGPEPDDPERQGFIVEINLPSNVPT